jgi:hypothetical protein
MASTLPVAAQDTLRRIQRIQVITIVWMVAEAVVSLSAAWIARSPALLAFGGDSAIELLSAIVVLWRFRGYSAQEHAERRASRIAGILLFALATYVVGASSLHTAGVHRSQTHLYRDRRFDRSRRSHAMACEGKTETFLSYRQFCVESRFLLNQPFVRTSP